VGVGDKKSSGSAILAKSYRLKGDLPVAACSWFTQNILPVGVFYGIGKYKALS